MENVRCKFCGSIAVKRKGSEFCSVRCKNNYHNSKKQKKTDNGSIETDKHASKNVSLPSKEQIPPKRIVEKFKTETLAFLACSSKLKKLQDLQIQVEQAIIEREQKLENLNPSNPMGSMVVGAIAGSAGGLLSAGVSALGFRLFEKFLEKDLPTQKEQLANEVNQLNQKLYELNAQVEAKIKELAAIPRYQVMERIIDNPAYMVYQFLKRDKQERELQRKAQEEAQKKKLEQKQLEHERLAQEERERLIEELESSNTKESIEVEQPQEQPQQPKHRIISSKELCKMNFPTLEFKGKWLDFMGKPETNSCVIIHGRPGSGKTSFTVILSKYLALKFGKVIIVTKEEGFGETLKAKMQRFDAIVDNIDIANFISLEQIYENIPQNEYNFIVLDSLGKLEIDAKALEQLREHYSNSLIIAIAQSTKDGKARGSNELIHDADIEISVTNGVATSIKNRFQETGREYKIF